MTTLKPPVVVVGMSGGVDSSTSALLLKQQGFEVIGVYLHFWYEASPAERRAMSEERCCSIEGQADARRVARQIGIPFYTLNFSDAFKTHVVDYFVSGYRDGTTPNPCIQCNKKIKFGLFWEKARNIFHADYIATGHYAQVEARQSSDGNDGPEKYILKKGHDLHKDQSYFIYHLDQKILSHVLFPIGHLTKPEVRAIAEKNNLIVAKKGESQGLCFLRENKHQGFLLRNIPEMQTSGEVIDETGNILGTHQGLSLYTIGQRQGIQIGGNGPYYVVARDFGANTLIVTNDRSNKKISSRFAEINDVRWTHSEPNSTDMYEVRIRHGHVPAPARITHTDGIWKIEFQEAQRAITIGQSAVLYRRDHVIGGGIIVGTL